MDVLVSRTFSQPLSPHYQGAPAELALKGNLKAKFSPASNKLISVSIHFDTGVLSSQVNSVFKSPDIDMSDEVDAAAAAQVAASEADAILDSLQMPHIEHASSVPSNVTVATQISVEKEESSVVSNSENEDAAKTIATTQVQQTAN